MKHTDLMLNDLVMYQGKILRVGCISDYDIKIDLFEDGEDTPYAEIWQEELDEVEPIPLTADILQKIGLRQLVVNGKDGEQEYYVLPMLGYYNLTPEQRLHQSSCVYSPRKDHTCGWLFINANEGKIEVICDYVHQVQRQFKYIGWDSDFKLN